MNVLRTRSNSPVRPLIAFAALVVAFALASCYPGSISDVAELDVVVTFRDAGAPLGTGYTKYAMPDTVLHLCDPDANQDCVELSRSNDELILSEVERQMEALGYERIAVPDTIPPGTEPPDSTVVLLVSALGTKDWVAYSTWWPGWGGWGGWGWWPGYPGYGWGYPSTGVTSFRTGTVFMEMLDPNDADEDREEIPVLWTGSINGLLEPSSVPSSVRLTTTIQQAFRQSPYLKVQ